MNSKIKIALLDFNNGEPNQGMRCITNIAQQFENQANVQIFDVRAKTEIPTAEHDIYICSGGPGNPLDGDGTWDRQFYQLIHDLWNWNMQGNRPKKYVFFICHSFQMACHLFGVGEVTPRKSKSFGVFPIHKTPHGQTESLLSGLPDPFYGADFRDYQVISPQVDRLEDLESNILALEKIRPHVKLERAVMAIRFSDEFFGVQFHPEADAEGMLKHFANEERKAHVIENYGQEKFDQIIRDLKNPDRIELTQQMILPRFIANAIEQLKSEEVFVY